MSDVARGSRIVRENLYAYKSFIHQKLVAHTKKTQKTSLNKLNQRAQISQHGGRVKHWVIEQN